MRPEICRLLVPTIYTDLVDHESVLSYPNVRGTTKNLFFITHKEPEAAVIGCSHGSCSDGDGCDVAKFSIIFCRKLIPCQNRTSMKLCTL